MRIVIWKVVILLAQGIRVSGYANGPPRSTCLTMFPKHDGAQSDRSPSPFKIELSPSSYNPGDEINVTLSATDRRSFNGVQIRAHRTHGDTETILGTFTRFPGNKLKSFDCMGDKQNMVGHKNADHVTQLDLTWRAPPSNEGDLVFTATFLQGYTEFWVNVQSTLTSLTPVTPASVQQVSTNGTEFSFDECGVSLGCILYPSYCSGRDCDLGATYKTNGNNVTFQLFAKAEGYVSLGFSDDVYMGNDQTISCTAQDDRVTIQHGWNPKLFNERQYVRNQFTDMWTMQKDGYVYCSFTRPKLMTVYNPNFPQSTQKYDLDDDFYVMIAQGYTYKGTDVMGYHKELPVTTFDKVNFNSNKIYRAGALPLLTKVHGSLMLIAWVLFAGLTSVISRHYRKALGSQVVCGSPVWLQSHRSAAILAFILAASSFVIIFVKVNGLTETAILHGWFGVAVMAITVLQISSGMLRPAPDVSYRPLFNWGHWFFGKSLQLLSAVTFFLAFNTTFIPSSQKLFGTITIAIWVGIQIIWELVLEIRKCRQTGDDKYELKKDDEQSRISAGDKMILIFYILTMFLILTATMVAIFIF